MSCASLPHARRRTPLMSTGLQRGYDPTKAAREERDRREKRHQEAGEAGGEGARGLHIQTGGVAQVGRAPADGAQGRPALHSPLATDPQRQLQGPDCARNRRLGSRRCWWQHGIGKARFMTSDSGGRETKRLRELAVEEHARQEASTVVDQPSTPSRRRSSRKKRTNGRNCGSTVSRSCGAEEGDHQAARDEKTCSWRL